MNKKYVLFLLFNFFWFYAFTQIDVNSYVNGDVIVAKISVRGNVKTEVSIVLRELEFHENEIVAINQLDTLIAKTENNLINSKLFNFAHIEKTFSNDSVYLDIQLIERWYTWVFPVFELADGNFNTWWETKDFDRVDYGLLFTQENFRGRRETIKLKAISGFNEYLNIVYEIPYMSESKHFGIRLETEVSRRHNTQVDTENDEFVYYNDDNNYPYGKTIINVGLLFRNKINDKHVFELCYDEYAFADTLLKINPDYLNSINPNTNFLSLVYLFKSDYRNVVNYPLHGYYFDLNISKIGLGILDDKVDFFRIKSNYKRYWKYKKRWYIAASVSMVYSTQEKQPFFLNMALGTNKYTVRSYEFNVVNGNSYGLFRSNLKYALIPRRTAYFDFIPVEQFKKAFYALYLNAFIDCGYVHGFEKWQNVDKNYLVNKLLVGRGVGIDFVTYYDKVFGLEYSWHDFDKGAFFVHFIAPI